MKLQDDKSTYKENINSTITLYQLVGEIHRIEEGLWELNKKCENYFMVGLCDRMCFLMTK